MAKKKANKTEKTDKAPAKTKKVAKATSTKKSTKTGGRKSSKPLAVIDIASEVSAAPAKSAPATTGSRRDGVIVAKAHAPTHDEIARRAYEVYVRNGYIPHQDEHNWRTAERELRAERGLA